MRDIFGAPSHNVLVKTCRISTLQNSWDWVVAVWPLKGKFIFKEHFSMDTKDGRDSLFISIKYLATEMISHD